MRNFSHGALALACALPLAAIAQSAAPKSAPAPAAPAAACDKVKLTTSKGPITIALDPVKAPISSKNFAQYVQSGHYNGTIFHRVIDGFMIQGGGFTSGMSQKPTGAPIKNEASNGLSNDKYTISMARTSDPDSATAQFFINVNDNLPLNAGPGNPGYAVFGKVVQGQDTVDKIRTVPTGNAGGHQNVPTTPVVIEKAECVK